MLLDKYTPLYLEVGTEVYKGMILGKRNRPGDLDINITREKAK